MSLNLPNNNLLALKSVYDIFHDFALKIRHSIAWNRVLADDSHEILSSNCFLKREQNLKMLSAA